MRLFALLFICLFGSVPVIADDAPNGWSGEGSFSAGTSTGNTETTDIGLGLDIKRTQDRWVFAAKAQADYGKIDGAESKNRVFLSGTADYQISDRLYGFGQASYEKDEFSGFENRYFIGGGLGWNVLDGDKAKWSVRGGPGFKVDEIREVAAAGVITTPGETVESFSVIASSDYVVQLNDNVSFSNETNALYASESTQISNTLALTASLTNTLSARFSFDVRHDTNPPAGFEATDTTTRVSLVYKFGG